MIALLIFSGRADLMGAFVNGRITHWAGLIGTAVVLLLNAFLVLQILGVNIPGLPGGT
jgi:manganese transport protein